MKEQKRLTYRAAGVDIERGDEFVKRITPSAGSTRTSFSMDSIGAFAGMIDMASGGWKDPVLVACTDGVGTKLKFAFETGKHRTIGIDLVAMSINDLLVTGADPLAFLDYLATSRIDLKIHPEVVAGIADGCIQGGCALIGGETAELPDFYGKDEYDLAGFAVGVVERSRILHPGRVKPGDLLIGLPSTGVHSNGYSLVRKVFQDRDRYPLHKPLPGFTVPLGDLLLAPTRIYRPEFEILKSLQGLKSAAHITGSGIPGNLPRAIPEDLGVSVIKGSWPILPVFSAIQTIGNVSDTEMFRTFNMGLGMILVVDPVQADAIRNALSNQGFSSYPVGQVDPEPGFRWIKSGISRTRSGNHKPASELKSHPLPRVAILGSGRGSNMESLCAAMDRGDLDVAIVCVISNNSKAPILEIARLKHLPAFHISSKTHPGTETAALLEILEKQKVDTLILAGYMKKLPDEIVLRYTGRAFNIHPALLPSFGGPGMFGHHVHAAVLASGVKVTGVTVHRIGSGYDNGEILCQRVVPVLASDTVETLSSRVLREEHDLYWRVVQRSLKTGDGET